MISNIEQSVKKCDKCAIYVSNFRLLIYMAAYILMRFPLMGW